MSCHAVALYHATAASYTASRVHTKCDKNDIIPTVRALH